MLPRGERDQIAAFVFLSLRRLYNIGLRFTTTYEQRDRVMSSYGPVGLLLLLPVWLILVASGYVLMYLATGIKSVYDSIVISGSSLLTLGLFKGNSLVDVYKRQARNCSLFWHNRRVRSLGSSQGSSRFDAADSGLVGALLRCV